MGIFFNTTKHQSKTITIFDIGSNSVAGASVLIPKNPDKDVPVVLESIRTPIRQAHNQDNGLREKEAIVALKKTAESLIKLKIGKIDQIFCVITTPWCVSETKKISISNQKSLNITNKILNSLVNKELETIFKDIQNTGVNKQIIETLITEVLIDDKPTKNPVGERAQFLDFGLSYSYCNSSFLEKSKAVLSEVFHSPDINFSAFSILTHLMIRNNYIGQDSYLIMDVTGENTDISIVNKGTFSQKYSFPFGKQTLLRHLSTQLKIEERDAYELFKLYYQNILSLTHREKFKNIFLSVEKYWSEELKKYLTSILKYHKLPDTIFLTIDNDMRNWFFEVFKNTEYSNNITLGKQFKIIILDGGEMADLCFSRSKTLDPFIMIEAIALSNKIK